MAFSTKAGNFTKNTSTPGPQSQAITGVGFQPKALFLWMGGNLISGSFAAGSSFSAGFTSGASDSFSVNTCCADNVSPSNTRRRMALKVLSVTDPDGTLLAECDLTSFDSDGFTLSWTTNNAFGYIIHYLALGGSDLTNAKVIPWQMPTTDTTKAVTGVGFQPDIVFTLQASGIGSSALPQQLATATFGFGAMTASDQWCNFFLSEDNVNPTDTYRQQRTDAMLSACNVSGTQTYLATYLSMDADGFTTTFTGTDGTAHRLGSLCLKGGSYKIGNGTKPTGAAPQTQTFTTTGFTPTGYLLTSHQFTAGSTIASNARIGIGASDGTVEQSVAMTDTDNLATSSVDNIGKTDKVFVKCNNNTTTVDAEADDGNFSAGSFDISWSTNDAIATQILFAAFGNAAAAGTNVTTRMMMGMGM